MHNDWDVSLCDWAVYLGLCLEFSPGVSVSQISSLSVFNWHPGLISISYGDVV